MLFYVCVVTCYSSHWHVMTHSAPSTTSSSGRSKFLYHTMTAQLYAILQILCKRQPHDEIEGI